MCSTVTSEEITDILNVNICPTIIKRSPTNKTRWSLRITFTATAADLRTPLPHLEE